MKVKKVPLRKCVSCGNQFPKKELIRVVNHAQEGVIVDTTGKKNGRGAYLCTSIDCLHAAKKNRKLQHALKTQIEDGVYEQIEELLQSSE